MKKLILSIITLTVSITVKANVQTTLLHEPKDGFILIGEIPYDLNTDVVLTNAEKNLGIRAQVHKKDRNYAVLALKTNERGIGEKGDKLKVYETHPNIQKTPAKTLYKIDIPERPKFKNIPQNKTEEEFQLQKIHEHRVKFAAIIQKRIQKRKNTLILPPEHPNPKGPDNRIIHKPEKSGEPEYALMPQKAIQDIKRPETITPEFQGFQKNKIIGGRPTIGVVVVEALKGEFEEGQTIQLKSEGYPQREFVVIRTRDKFTMMRSKNMPLNPNEFVKGKTINDYNI